LDRRGTDHKNRIEANDPVLLVTSPGILPEPQFSESLESTRDEHSPVVRRSRSRPGRVLDDAQSAGDVKIF